MWMRRCPHCGVTLYKPNLRDILTCVCGWVWGR